MNIEDRITDCNRIGERILFLEDKLDNAERYLRQGRYVEGRSWFHFDDWRGRSGHPKWVKNKMIPTTKKLIAEQERKVAVIEAKLKDREITDRRKNETIK